MICWRRRRKPGWVYVWKKLREIEERQKQIMADTTKLTAAVAANTQAVADVQAVVAGLRGASDQVAVDAAATQIEANTSALEALKPPPVTPTST
jgi:hypothetical protein